MTVGPFASSSTAGRLLVASPELDDPSFRRSVVLMVEHSTDGALGIVLNRPTHSPVGLFLQMLEHACAEPSVIFEGGPVVPDGVICLASAAPGADVDGYHPVTAAIGRLDIEDRVITGDVEVDRIRLFAGHSGWGPGQLEGELALSAWFVLDARPDDAFCDDPEQLWTRVLRRQGGELSRLSRVPADPRLN